MFFKTAKPQQILSIFPILKNNNGGKSFKSSDNTEQVEIIIQTRSAVAL